MSCLIGRCRESGESGIEGNDTTQVVFLLPSYTFDFSYEASPLSRITFTTARCVDLEFVPCL